ncbi:MAG: DUF1318 domain-containing protein, partial [Planctomycetia bacterium]|nr:DUF1318 domain-containing protein [Planctomycetia bacterium]
ALLSRLKITGTSSASLCRTAVSKRFEGNWKTRTMISTQASTAPASLYGVMVTARANGQPTWEAEIRKTFARRWIDNAPGGWWYQDSGGSWKRK